jgi:hypothetical protein
MKPKAEMHPARHLRRIKSPPTLGHREISQTKPSVRPHHGNESNGVSLPTSSSTRSTPSGCNIRTWRESPASSAARAARVPRVATRSRARRRNHVHAGVRSDVQRGLAWRRSRRGSPASAPQTVRDSWRGTPTLWRRIQGSQPILPTEIRAIGTTLVAGGRVNSA